MTAKLLIGQRLIKTSVLYGMIIGDLLQKDVTHVCEIQRTIRFPFVLFAINSKSVYIDSRIMSRMITIIYLRDGLLRIPKQSLMIKLKIYGLEFLRGCPADRALGRHTFIRDIAADLTNVVGFDLIFNHVINGAFV